MQRGNEPHLGRKKAQASAGTHTHSSCKNGEHEAESQLQSLRMKLNFEVWRSVYGMLPARYH